MNKVTLDSRQSWYVLGLLSTSYALAYIDRQMLNLLVEPIKTSLQLTDTQFSLVQGLAFVSAYLMAIPIFGRLVDITNRRNILIFGVCAWSICTALCGRAESYGELFAARFGVGVSEACVFPVAWSLIADYFSEKKSPRAFSVFQLGVQIGGGFSLVAGGLVIAFAGNLRAFLPALQALEAWQMAFVVIGLPGLLLGAWLLTVTEPERRKILATDTVERNLTIRESAAGMWERRHFYGRMYLGVGMIAVVQLGIPSWFPAFLIRTHGMSPAEVGYQLGVVALVFGTIGTLLGPVVARWFVARGHVDGGLRAVSFSTLGMLACCAAIPIAPGTVGALTAVAGVIFFCGFPVAILASAIQIATPRGMRGVVAAFYSFSSQIIGYGIGPTAVALITDDRRQLFI